MIFDLGMTSCPKKSYMHVRTVGRTHGEETTYLMKNISFVGVFYVFIAIVLFMKSHKGVTERSGARVRGVGCECHASAFAILRFCDLLPKKCLVKLPRV